MPPCCSALRSGGGSSAYADDYTTFLTSDNGFTEVTTVDGLQSGSGYYYVFASAEDPTLVLRTGKYYSKLDWITDASWSMYYANSISSPVTDLHNYYVLDYNSTYGIGVKSAVNTNYCFQTHEGCAYLWITSFYETASSEWSGLLPTYDATNGYWIFQEYQFRNNSDSYLGPWTAGSVVDGMAIAGNRTNTTDDLAGHFKVYRISTTDYTTLCTKLGNTPLYPATSDNPVNATYLITNPSFETGDLTGWTTNGDSDNVEIGAKTSMISNGDGQYVLNMFQWWTSMTASQTVSLPAGVYDISAVVAAWEIDDVTFTAGSKSVTKTGQGDATGIAVSISDIEVGADNSLTISASSSADWFSDGRSTDDNWQYACGFFKLDNVQLTCKGVYLSYFAKELPNDTETELTEDQWYYYDASSLGQYSLDGDVANIVYTQNGEQVYGDGITTKQAQSVLTLNAGRVYFKATKSGLTLTITNQTTDGATKTFTVTTLNVDGLPNTVAGITLNSDGPGSSGTKLISQYLAAKGYDFIGVEEDFNYHGSLMSSLDGYNSGTVRATLSLSNLSIPFDTDGLNLIWHSDNGFVASGESWTRWTTSTSTDGNQYIKKGFRYYKMQLEEGMVVDVYVVHMDAGDEESGAVDSRNAQWAQLAQAILDNGNTSRPKLVIGDTNSRWTRESIKDNFFTPLASYYNVSDVWVELERSGSYPTTSDNTIDDEVVDKIIYLNPLSTTTTLQLTPKSFKIESDYTYGTVDSSADDPTKALGDHSPLVVTFTATQPAYTYSDDADLWQWKGEELTSGTANWYLYNVSFGDNNKQGFLQPSSSTLITDPNNAGNVFGFYDSDGSYSISNSDGYRLQINYSLGSGYSAAIATSSATAFKVFDTNDSESNSSYAGNTGLAYHFKASDHYFGATSVSALSAKTTIDATDAWALISPDQVAVYNRYVAARAKGKQYLASLPLSSATKEELYTLLNTATYWTEGTTEKLETLNTDIEEWFDDDQTSYIVNPSFELSAEGVALTTTGTTDNNSVYGWSVTDWTTEGEAFISYAVSGQTRYFDGLNGSYVYNTWGGTPSGQYYCEQTISDLPEGFYKLTANFCSGDASNTITLKLGDQSTTSTVAVRPSSTTIEVPLYYCDGESDVTIGAYSSTWFEADNFVLTRYDYYYDATITTAEYATTAIRYNTDIPSGFEVYYATQVNETTSTGTNARNTIQLAQYTGSQLKAEEGVVLYAEGLAEGSDSKSYRFYRTVDDVSAISDNILKGTSTRIEASALSSDSTYYLLAKKTIDLEMADGTTKADTAVVGFYPLSSGVAIKAHKAYLPVASSTTAKQLYTFSFGDEADITPTAIRQVETAEDASVIGIYSLSGTRQSQLQRGINIVRMSDGRTKKILVK